MTQLSLTAKVLYSFTIYDLLNSAPSMFKVALLGTSFLLPPACRSGYNTLRERVVIFLPCNAFTRLLIIKYLRYVSFLITCLTCQ